MPSTTPTMRARSEMGWLNGFGIIASCNLLVVRLEWVIVSLGCGSAHWQWIECNQRRAPNGNAALICIDAPSNYGVIFFGACCLIFSMYF